jgi:hypothetical protein
LQALGKEILYTPYFFELGVVGKNGRKNIGGCWKGPIFFFKRPSRAPKMEITNTGAINGSGNDFMDNLYAPRLSMYGN